MRRRIHPLLLGQSAFSGIPGAQMFRTAGGAVRPGYAGLGSVRLHQNSADFPMPTGAPGSDLYPYEERNPPWGANVPGGGGAGDMPPAVDLTQPGTLPSLQDGGYLPVPAPFGPTDPRSPLRWTNPTTFAAVPINSSTSTTMPVLSLNYQRNGLIIQNNSTATAPDTTATFYVGFNAQPQIGFALTLTAGIGVSFDIICPRDSIYVLFAGNTGATSVVAGVIIQGTYAPGVFTGQPVGGGYGP
jgi:hypothetical protein